MLQGILARAVEWERIGSNPVRAVHKPRTKRQRAIVPLPPSAVERLRRELPNLLDSTLVAVLAYSGLRPEEALALEWRHVHDRTLLVERAVADGQLKDQKTRRPPRTIDLLAPLRQDLAEWRLASGRPEDDALVFPAVSGGLWREHDYRNWRRRNF